MPDHPVLQFQGASSNPFACAAAMQAAVDHQSIQPLPLIPDWPLGMRRTPAGLSCLMAPLVPLYDTNASPVLTEGKEREGLEAMLSAIRRDASLPKVIVAHTMVAEGPGWEALLSMQDNHGVELTTLASWERAIGLRSAGADGEAYLAQSLSGSSRKRLRAKRRGLEAEGPLRLHVHQSHEAVSAAFEVFLTLEAAGWKGRNGTALRQHPRDAQYIRAVLLALAAGERAFVATLVMGERVISAGLFLRAGGEVTFWKTTYDEALAKDSPGVIFDMMLTEHFFREPWFTLLDSASDETVDPAGLIWKQRRRMARVVIDLQPRSWQGRGIVAGYRLRNRLKSLRNRIKTG